LLRRGTLGPEHVGNVLSSGTRFWVGDTFGLGFYTAGRLRFGFVFDRHRRGLNDQVELEPLRGALASADCKLSAERGWLSIVTEVGPRLEHRLTVVGRDGKRIAHTDSTSESWLAGLEGACALGPVLLVPTDDGVVRLETDGPEIVVGKTFAQTSAVVHAGTTLVRGERNLYAVTDGSVFELSC